jgi:hypothetical protein
MRKMYKLRFELKPYRAAHKTGADKQKRQNGWPAREVYIGGRRPGSCAVRNADADTTGLR